MDENQWCQGPVSHCGADKEVTQVDSDRARRLTCMTEQTRNQTARRVCLPRERRGSSAPCVGACRLGTLAVTVTVTVPDSGLSRSHVPVSAAGTEALPVALAGVGGPAPGRQLGATVESS